MKNLYVLIFIFKFLFGISQPSYTVISTNTSSEISHLSVINNTYVVNGWSNFLVKSNNECNSFIPLCVANPFANYYNHSFCALKQDTMYVMSANTSFTNQKIYKSTDGGNSWIKKLDTSNKYLDFIGFFDTNEGIAICESNKILRTKNGGLTWVSNISPSAYPSAFTTYSDSLAILGDSFGSIYLSKDRGNSWNAVWGFPTYPQNFSFLNKDTIFGITYSGNFCKTFNAGATWTNSILAENSGANKIFFKNKNEGYIIGQNTDVNNNQALILKTTNLGQTWLKYELPIQELLMDMIFMNDSIALVSGTNGLLFKWNTKQTQFVGLSENTKTDIKVSIFPNPVTDKLSIEFKDVNFMYCLKLTNPVGEVIYSGFSINLKEKIDLSYLESGIYLLNIETEKGNRTFKIVKQ